MKDSRSRGQVLVLFALLLTFLLGTCAFVVDLAWIWVNELKVQRAADSAALAGVVHLPGAVGLANSSALDESRFNGYRDSTNNAIQQPAQAVDVWARPDPGDPRKMLVRVQANIETFFMQIFGFDTLRITRDAKAEYVLPVPMGSPESYYGVFGALRTPAGGVWQPQAVVSAGPRTSTAVTSSSTSTGTNPNNSSDSCSTSTNVNVIWGQNPAPGAPATSTLDDRVSASDDQWIKSSLINNRVCFGSLGFNIPNVVTPGNTNCNGAGTWTCQGPYITGIEVRIEGFATDSTGCSLNVDLMWGAAGSGGANNTADKAFALTGSEPVASPYSVLGGAGDLWGHAWTEAEVESANFRVRLWNTDPAGCSATSLPAYDPPGPAGPPAGAVAGEVYIDLVQVVVHYDYQRWIPDQNVVDPYGGPLNARGLWGTFINQGAEKVNGDAYLPKWDPRTSGANAEYNPNQYYNYAVEMPAGATSGEVWVFDAPFCATDSGGQYGTGDRWFAGSTNATSAYYTLYDTNNTLFDTGDDTIVSQTPGIFANQQASDTTLNGPGGVADCAPGATGSLSDGRFWHNRWYPMQNNPGGGASSDFPASASVGVALPLQGGHTYRLHTRSTNPSNPTAMDNANGHNSFSIWTKANCSGACGAAPRVYGLGAMEAFTPLDGGGSAQFYLAEIEPIHVGKSVEIRLWDPGDTGNLSATLRVKVPVGGAYVDAPLDWVATRVASGAANCTGKTDNNVNPPATISWPDGSGSGDPYIVTNTGGSSQFNGCWLTIVVVIPGNYDGVAPTAGDQNWWKIEYSMGGASTDNAFDLTTWQVTIRGNPVHLVVP